MWPRLILSLSLTALVICPVRSLVWEVARPTPAIYNDPAHNGWTPKPTGAVDHALLFARQVVTNACGVWSNNPTATFTCSPGFNCAINLGLGLWGCCWGQVFTDCTLPSVCFDSTDAVLYTGSYGG